MFLTPFIVATEAMEEDTLPPPVEDAPLVLPVDPEEPTPKVPEMPEVPELPTTEDMEISPYVDDEAMDILPEADMVTVDDELPPDTDVMDELDEEVQGSESLLMEIEHLQNLAVAIETYGISPGMMFIADRDGLLSSTFISIPATESMAGPYRPESQTSTVALEGVMDAIKAKSAEWAAHVGSTLKSLADKAGTMVKHAAEATAAMGKAIAGKTWDTAKAAVATVKAHPYKTVVAVLTAIAAVGATLALIWAFPTQATQVATWFKRVQSAVQNIKMPGGRISVQLPQLSGPEGSSSKALVKWVAQSEAGSSDPISAKIDVLGWTKNAILSAASMLSGGLMKVAGLIMKAVHIIHMPARVASSAAGAAAGTGAVAAARALGAGAGTQKIAGALVGFVAFRMMMRFALVLTYKLLAKVVIKGYRLVKSTITKVASAVTTGGSAEPASA